MKAETLVYLEKRFEKLRKLHQTAKGEVWLATDPDGKLVMWKTIQLTGLPYAAIKKIPHPLLPEVLHVAEDEESTIVIEEYIQGRPLSELVARKKFLKEAEVRSILLQLCSGLALLHGKGIIHRDIKPSNLILQKNGDVRLIDFDAARVVKEGGEEDTHLLGTRGYAPPEQFGCGQIDARSGIYSLGVTLKKLLSPGYRGYLHRILDKCTEVDAKRRYGAVKKVPLENQFVHGRGNHKSIGQRHYEKLMEYASKLTEYVEKINICGAERNSYAKTDHDATFMRMKKDYMGNDQLLHF